MYIGYDIASRRIGFCAGTGAGMPEADVLEFPQVGVRLGDLGALYWQCLEAHFARFQPTAVIFEAPIKKPTDKTLTLRKLYGLEFQLETFCKIHGVPVREATIQDVKREATGNPRAEKEDVVASAIKCGVALPDGEGAKDAADAWGAWLICLRDHDRRLSEQWDRRIHSARGALF